MEAELAICSLTNTPYPVGGLKFVSIGDKYSLLISPSGFGNELDNRCFSYTPDPFPETKLVFNSRYI